VIRMVLWGACAIAFTAYGLERGGSLVASIGVFFCGANYALADLGRIQRPLFDKLCGLLKAERRATEGKEDNG
jgi:hypothetical protein